MDLLTILRAVLRRWYVVVPVGLLALGAAVYVQATIPPQYEARGSVLLESPEFDTSRLPSSVVNANALLDRIETGDTLAELGSGGASLLPLAIERNAVELQAVAAEPADAISSVETGLEWLRDEAAQLQEDAGIPEEDRLRASILTPDLEAEVRADGRFVASGRVVFRDPAAATSNPYSASSSTVGLLTEILRSEAGRLRVAERTSGGAGFQLSSSREADAVINVTTTGSEPEAVIAAYHAVAEELAVELDQRQERADVPATRRITVVELSIPHSVVDVSPPLNRSVAAIVGLGGILALSMALGLESFLALRPGRSATTDESKRGAQWWGTEEASEPTPAPERTGPGTAR